MALPRGRGSKEPILAFEPCRTLSDDGIPTASNHITDDCLSRRSEVHEGAYHFDMRRRLRTVARLGQVIICSISVQNLASFLNILV